MRVCAARAHARACVRVRERGHLRAFARACTDKRSTGNNLRTSSGMLSARRACFPSPPWPRPPSAPSKQSIVAPRLTRARIPHMVRLFCPPRAPPRASAAVRVSLLSDRKFAPNSSATEELEAAIGQIQGKIRRAVADTRAQGWAYLPGKGEPQINKCGPWGGAGHCTPVL